jgi:hypothetical protein
MTSAAEDSSPDHSHDAIVAARPPAGLSGPASLAHRLALALARLTPHPQAVRGQVLNRSRSSAASAGVRP